MRRESEDSKSAEVVLDIRRLRLQVHQPARNLNGAVIQPRREFASTAPPAASSSMTFLANSTALLVDVDGVVTDEHARVDRDATSLLIAAVRGGAALAFISGRSRVWLEANLIPVIQELPGDDVLDRITFAAEMGAVQRARGTTGWTIRQEHAVPLELREALVPLIQNYGLAHLVAKSGRAVHTIVRFDIEPGDVIAFHYRTVHAAPGTAGLTNRRRRAVSLRYIGDDAVFALRPWLHSPPFEQRDLVVGQALDDPRFPLVSA